MSCSPAAYRYRGIAELNPAVPLAERRRIRPQLSHSHSAAKERTQSNQDNQHMELKNQIQSHYPFSSLLYPRIAYASRIIIGNPSSRTSQPIQDVLTIFHPGL